MSKPRLTHVESGCSLHPNCFTCSLPDCKIKDKDLILAPKAKATAAQLYREGLTIGEIAKTMGKPPNTVKRWLRRENVTERRLNDS